METTTNGISQEAKQTIFTACKSIIEAKAKRAKDEMRLTEGVAFVRMPHKDFDKMVQRQNDVDIEFMKTSLHSLYKNVGKDEFSKFIEEAKAYTNEQFLKDIEEVFGIDNANFLKIEIYRLF